MRTAVVAVAGIFLAACAVITSTPPAQSQEALEYRVFLPAIANTTETALRGVTITRNTCDDLNVLGATWTYTWRPEPYSPKCDGWIPMYANPTHFDTVAEPDDWLLVFNEPDLAGLENENGQTPQEAAANWRMLEQRHPGVKFAGPAASHMHPEWITEWHTAYVTAYGEQPRLDAITWHCYAGWPACGELGEYYIDLAEEWDAEVWLTEWAIDPRRINWQEEMRSMLDWADANMDRHAHYTNRIRGDEAWAMFDSSTGLLDYDTGTLSQQGQIWMGN